MTHTTDHGTVARTLETLRWAAGVGGATPQEFGPADTLLPLLMRHRLVGRTLERLEDSGSAVRGAAELRETMQTQFTGVLEKCRRQLSAATEIDRAWGDAPVRPVLFKGLTAFALTGKLSRMRPAGDLDVICGDTDRYRTLLPSLGYEEVRFHPTGHEMGAFHRDDICIELHRFSPVCWAPPVKGAGVPGFRHEGGIPYAVFSAHHTRVPVGDEGTVTVPTPELAAVITCTNLYKDYALNGFPRPFGTTPLGHLAEIVDFAAHPDFDAGRFVEIARECRAAPSVELAVALLDRHGFGVPPAFPAAASDPAPRLRNLAMDYAFTDGTPGADEQLLDDLVVRRGGFDDYLAYLSPSPVLAGGDADSAPWYRTAPGSDFSVGTTVDTGDLDVRFRLLLTDSGLRCDVGVRNDGANFEVLLDVGDHGLWGRADADDHTVDSQVYQRLTKIRGITVATSVDPIEECDGVSSFSVELPPDTLAPAVSALELTALLSVRTYEEKQRAAVIPIRIGLPRAPAGGVSRA